MFVTCAQSPVHTIRFLTDLSSTAQSRGAGKAQSMCIYRSVYFTDKSVDESLNRSNTADEVGRT